MANGFWNRMSNLWRGFLSLWVSDIEKKHPEIAYENAINSMVEKYVKLKQATAAIIRRRDDVAGRLKVKSKELAQVDLDLRTAVETNQEDLGMVLIQKKESLTAEVASLKEDLEGSVRDADSAKSSLMQVQTEIQKLKAEKENMMAKMASAEVKVRIQEQLEGLSVDAEVKALDNVRGHIKETIAQANLGDELAETDIDARLRKLRASSGDVTAKSEWEKLRQASAASQGQKTM
ncbi:PspA/IM30 family protein [Haliangium sp.]|uniref:PspA/IM30 family protein n=1 Tax=Haliangium sp. TaxID=2663208 RepID=UPI003D117FB9